MPTATFNLQNKYGAARANESGFDWAFFDADPATGVAPVDGGSGETTDAAGQMVLTLTNSVLTSGQKGYLLLKGPTANELSYHEVFVD